MHESELTPDQVDGEPPPFDDSSVVSDTTEPGPSKAAVAPLHALLDAIDADAVVGAEAEPHVRAFAAWIKRGADALVELSRLAEAARELTGGARTYRHVAVLGFAVAALPEDQVERATITSLDDGLRWLAGREWFLPGRVPTFEADAIALLGVALGLTRGAPHTHVLGRVSERPAIDPELHRWGSELLARSASVLTDGWERGLSEAGRYVLQPSTVAAERVTEAAPDLAVALMAQGQLAADRSVERRALETIASLTYRGYGPDRAVTQGVALRWLLRSAAVAVPDHVTVSEVITLLEGVERSLRRWTWEVKPTTRGAVCVRWPITNEYHVQNLLWTILAPLFPDLEDEEQLPSLGQKHPRYDLGIPALQLIIEVKFVRGGATRDFAAVIEQVAADASLYLRNPERYRQMIAFVWDDARHSEQHGELMQGLLKLAGVVGAVIVARPGRMGLGERATKQTRKRKRSDPDDRSRRA